MWFAKTRLSIGSQKFRSPLPPQKPIDLCHLIRSSRNYRFAINADILGSGTFKFAPSDGLLQSLFVVASELETHHSACIYPS
jgi:hypothetical protein